MKTVSISGSLRANVGKKDAKQNRAEGKVPCVVYGGKEEMHFIVEEKDLHQIIFTPYNFLIDLDIEGKKMQAIMQDIQYHPVTEKPLHVDFLEVSEKKPVILSLPIRISGTSKGVLRGGKMVKKYRKLKVKGLAKDMPEEINIDITELDINDALQVSDVKVDNIQMLDIPTATIISIASTRAVEPAAGAAPAK